MNQELKNLKEQFLIYWTLEKLQTMTLEEYTDTKRKNSFCYWLEHITRDLGSIVGGSSYKFGIYKRNSQTEVKEESNRATDSEYAWFKKYGATKKEAFETVRTIILSIATNAQNNNLETIDNIDLGTAYKWKIAFLYGNYTILNIFKKEAIQLVANSMYPLDQVPENQGALNTFLLSKKGDEDFFSYSKKLWKHYDAYNSKAEEFKKWLKINNDKKSNKNNSYINAIKILITVFKIEVYTETNIEILQELYDDLLENQKYSNGKYSYEKKSYGEKGFYSAAIQTYIQFLKNEPNSIVSEESEEYKKVTKENSHSMLATNKILYGPPGTGKTYATKKIAVELIDGKLKDEYEDRNIIIERYNELEQKGQIVFTTFHQSMSYEDFVEGIKPKTSEDKKVTYEVEDGIFKQLTNKASFNIAERVKTEDITKSISFSNLYDDYVTKISEGLEKEEELKLATKSGGYVYIVGVSQQENLILKHKGGNTKYTVSKERLTKLNNGIDNLADIGNIHNTFRELIGGSNTSVYWAVLNKLQTIKASTTNNNSHIELNSEEKEIIINSLTVSDYKKVIGDPYVLIIDEINRGNVSAIFGELITLLEPDKRLGKEEAITVTLPYSKKTFGIPANLHIIGTMNTADRSVEALDTALRRRFEFQEIMPDISVIEDEKVSEVQLSKVLEKINQRIELLLDRDHTIGHSYFIGINNKETLKNIFNNKIIPLLQEYFYNDYEKIGLILGEGFVSKIEKNDEVKFPNFVTDANDFIPVVTYILKKIDAKFNIIQALESFLADK